MADQVSAARLDPVGVMSVMPFCAAPDVENFTPEQQAAVHVFKHEVLAAGYRLYETVPASMAAPLLTKLLKTIVAKLE